MATISVPFTSGVIADGAIQQRHLADGVVAADHIDPTWPVIMRNVVLNAKYYPLTRTSLEVNLQRVCKRALVVFMLSTNHHLSGQFPLGISFNFGAISVGVDHTWQGGLSALVPWPAVLATQDYRHAIRLTSGNSNGEWLDAVPSLPAGGQFTAYRDEGLYGWYSSSGQSSSFGCSDASAKGILESVWLEGTFLRMNIRSLAAAGSYWTFNANLNIYAI